MQISPLQLGASEHKEYSSKERITQNTKQQASKNTPQGGLHHNVIAAWPSSWFRAFKQVQSGHLVEAFQTQLNC